MDGYYSKKLQNTLDNLYGKIFKILPNKTPLQWPFMWNWNLVAKNPPYSIIPNITDEQFKEFENFILQFKDDYKYFVIHELAECTLSVNTLQDYKILFSKSGISPNRVVIITNNYAFDEQYDNKNIPKSDRFNFINFIGAGVISHQHNYDIDVTEFESYLEQKLYSNPDKLYVCCINRGSGVRKDFYNFTKNNFQNNSYISYREDGVYLDHSNKNLPAAHDFVKNDGRVVETISNKSSGISALTTYYHDTHFSVCFDSKEYDPSFGRESGLSYGSISEATQKEILLGSPFFMFGPKEPLKVLRSVGYKTFEPYFDESYDSEPDINKRLTMLKYEILRLSKLNKKELLKLKLQLNEVCLHNFDIYKRINKWKSKSDDSVIDDMLLYQLKKKKLL